jgi:hypothetical protein
MVPAMSLSGWARRIVRTIETALQQVDQTHERVDHTDRVVAAIETRVGEVWAAVEASSKAHLEALSFLTRSVNELSSRLDKLEHVGDDTEV